MQKYFQHSKPYSIEKLLFMLLLWEIKSQKLAKRGQNTFVGLAQNKGVGPGVGGEKKLHTLKE